MTTPVDIPSAPPQAAEELDNGLLALFEAHRKLKSERRSLSNRVDELTREVTRLQAEANELRERLRQEEREKETVHCWFSRCATAIRSLLGKDSP